MNSNNLGNSSLLDILRDDLLFQLKIPDELDWDYFLETATRAKCAADSENRNMVPEKEKS